MEAASTCYSEHNRTKNRNQFDTTMIDALEKIIIVKVFSHQLNSDFTTKQNGRRPSPNLFITSANQFVDNAAAQARELIDPLPSSFENIFYPIFFPRWCFTFVGQISSKGATKILQEKMDDELHCRLQHREKHGLLARLLPSIGLKPEQIGNESLLRTIVKLVAPCWTRCIYRYPALAKLIWRI